MQPMVLYVPHQKDQLQLHLMQRKDVGRDCSPRPVGLLLTLTVATNWDLPAVHCHLRRQNRRPHRQRLM